MNSAQIRDLVTLADQVKTRELAKYIKSKSKLGKITQQIADIHGDQKLYIPSVADNLKGVALWQRWSEAETVRLVEVLGTAKIEAERLRKVAFKAAAKHQSLEILLSETTKKELQTRRRRAEQNGQPPDA